MSKNNKIQMETKMLVSKISSIIKKFELINKKTGNYFNIFEIANISADEGKICRIIYELLSPKGSHYQETSYLKLFVEKVLKINDFDYSSVKVFKEYVIDNNRRIDLVIKNTDYLIPIEVKIYASDQENQCYDYYKAAIKSSVYYLTLFGDSPTEYSTKGPPITTEGSEIVTLISFKEDVISWLYSCVSHRETVVLAPIREILIQLISILRKMTGLVEEGVDSEMKKILMSSSENMKTAFMIGSSLKECQTELMYSFFSAIERRLEKHGMHKADFFDYTDDSVDEYYNKKSSSLPGISYLYKKNIKEDLDIYFRVEIDWNIYCGFCVTHKGKRTSDQYLTSDEIKKYISVVNPETHKWWAHWEYLPVNDIDNTINFMNPNEMYFMLYDKHYFDKVVDDCVTRVLLLCR